MGSLKATKGTRNKAIYIAKKGVKKQGKINRCGLSKPLTF
jgi:hypothetical protein